VKVDHTGFVRSCSRLCWDSNFPSVQVLATSYSEFLMGNGDSATPEPTTEGLSRKGNEHDED
jgi:hypothetical protein